MLGTLRQTQCGCFQVRFNLILHHHQFTSTSNGRTLTKIKDERINPKEIIVTQLQVQGSLQGSYITAPVPLKRAFPVQCAVKAAVLR